MTATTAQSSASGAARWRVHKFGGSSVADAACMRRVADILEADPCPRIGVVLSACKGVTDALLNLVAQAERRDETGYRAGVDALRAQNDARNADADRHRRSRRRPAAPARR